MIIPPLTKSKADFISPFLKALVRPLVIAVITLPIFSPINEITFHIPFIRLRKPSNPGANIF